MSSVTLSLLGPNIFLRTLSPCFLNLCLSHTVQVKFHTNTKQVFSLEYYSDIFLDRLMKILVISLQWQQIKDSKSELFLLHYCAFISIHLFLW
jgi:hypothetical protein